MRGMNCVCAVLVTVMLPLTVCAQTGLGEAGSAQQNQAPKQQKKGGFGARNGWYLGIGGGYNSVSDQGFRLAPDQPVGIEPSRHVSASHNAGWGAKLNVGYNFGRVSRLGAPRIEFEYAYRQNNVHQFRSAEGDLTGSDGHLEAQNIMINVLHDFMPESAIGPYIGIGGGYANIKYDDYRFSDQDVTHDSDWVFAYQAMVGVRYDLSPKADVTLDYRYLRAQHPDIAANNGSLDTNYISSAVMLGFQFTP